MCEILNINTAAHDLLWKHTYSGAAQSPGWWWSFRHEGWRSQWPPHFDICKHLPTISSHVRSNKTGILRQNVTFAWPCDQYCWVHHQKHNQLAMWSIVDWTFNDFFKLSTVTTLRLSHSRAFNPNYLKDTVDRFRPSAYFYRVCFFMRNYLVTCQMGGYAEPSDKVPPESV